jgi:hypothetical protein
VGTEMPRKQFHDPESIPPDVDAHHTGILLRNRVPGQRYTASTPNYRILASRETTGQRFIVHFFRRADSGPSPTAALIAGYDRASIERCIAEAIDKPSLLKFADRRSTKSAFPTRERTDSVSVSPEPCVDSNWPPIPGPHEPATKINFFTVSEGNIYRVTTRDFTVGVWRRDSTSNFQLSVVRHGTGMQRRQEVGNTLESVHEFILCALRSRYLPFWMKPAKPQAISPELWANARKRSAPRKKGRNKVTAGPRIVRRKKDDSTK